MNKKLEEFRKIKITTPCYKLQDYIDTALDDQMNIIREIIEGKIVRQLNPEKYKLDLETEGYNMALRDILKELK